MTTQEIIDLFQRFVIGNYKRFKSLTEKWIDLSIEYSRLKMKVGRKP